VPARLLPLLPLALLLAACGSKPAPRKPLPPVRLSVDAPLDTATVDGDTVVVRGTVSPAGAQVLVAGDEAGVSGGEFESTVALQPGANVIDVEAGAPRRAAALTAVRVVRRIPVTVPDLSGSTVAAATRRLKALGLKPVVEDGDGFITNLLPGDPAVCATSPRAGRQVRSSSTVTVEVSKSC
jgi:beta-lactam-binding protein with PASTA domain